MLQQVTEGVRIRQSQFCQSNTVVIQGEAGVLVVDPGILTAEIAELAQELHTQDQAVTAGFSTHPHWDHLLWHPDLGSAPRYGTAANAAAIQGRLADPDWKSFVVTMMPPDIAPEVPLDLFGAITGLPAGAVELPWEGPRAQVIEHQAHAPGHAALFIEERRVLIAGDMLSDVLIPILNIAAADPFGDYLAGLQLLEASAGQLDYFIPGHGSVGNATEMRARIEQDRAYLHALREGGTPDDPRIGPSATYSWVADVHKRQLQQLAST